jgi:hypothetical protein
MTRQRKIDMLLYTILDFITAMVAWACFFWYRKYIEGSPDISISLTDSKFWFGIFIVPTGWLLIYAIFDKYKDIYRLSRLATLTRTFFLTFIGVTFLFFTLILDDVVWGYQTYYQSFWYFSRCIFCLRQVRG